MASEELELTTLDTLVLFNNLPQKDSSYRCVEYVDTSYTPPIVVVLREEQNRCLHQVVPFMAVSLKTGPVRGHRPRLGEASAGTQRISKSYRYISSIERANG